MRVKAGRSGRQLLCEVHGHRGKLHDRTIATKGWCHCSPSPSNRTNCAQALKCEVGQGHQKEGYPLTVACLDRKKYHYSGISENYVKSPWVPHNGSRKLPLIGEAGS